jgi:hypothetical protein
MKSNRQIALLALAWVVPLALISLASPHLTFAAGLPLQAAAMYGLARRTPAVRPELSPAHCLVARTTTGRQVTIAPAHDGGRS